MACSASEEKLTKIKILLVGDGNTGKTTFVKKQKTGEFVKHYEETRGVQITSIAYNLSTGPIVVRLWDWDKRGDSKDGLREGLYQEAHGAIVMMDVSSKNTMRNAANWYTDIRRICGMIPIVFCGNKMDLQSDKYVGTLDALKLTFFRKHCTFVKISAKNNLNIEAPLIWLIRKICNDSRVEFVDFPAILPPLPSDAKTNVAIEEDLLVAESVSLPDSDSDF